MGPGTTSNTTVFSPSFAFNGWLVNAGSVDQVFEWTAGEGIYSIDLDGLSPGSIQQVVTTSPGRSYDLGFLLAANPGAGAIVSVRVTAGPAQQTFTFNPSGHTNGNMGWTRLHLTFVAQTNPTTIEFQSMDTPGSSTGPALDDVILIDRDAGYSEPFGSGCGGSAGAPSLAPNQVPFLGRPFSVLLGNLPANELAVVAVGFNPSNFPNPLLTLGQYGMPGCNLYTMPDFTDVIASTGVFGLYVWGVSMPNDPSLGGVRFVLQVFVHDAPANAAGITTTNALHCLIGH